MVKWFGKVVAPAFFEATVPKGADMGGSYPAPMLAHEVCERKGWTAVAWIGRW